MLAERWKRKQQSMVSLRRGSGSEGGGASRDEESEEHDGSWSRVMGWRQEWWTSGEWQSLDVVGEEEAHQVWGDYKSARKLRASLSVAGNAGIGVEAWRERGRRI